MDAVTAKADNAESFTKPAEGQVQGVCVDGIDLGMVQDAYPGRAPQMMHKYILVWQIDEVSVDTGKLFEVSKEFTVSMGEKANLRKFLGIWRGKSYSDAEAAEGAPLHKLYGVNGLLQIEHKPSKSNPDRSWTNIVSVTPLPKAMEKMAPNGYVRDEKRWKEKMGKLANETPEDDPDSDLPF